MSEAEREKFLVEGVKHYGEAYDAVVHFRGEFQQRLKDILTHKTNWKIFVPKKRNAVETEVRKQRGEYWICATVAGQIGVQPARISIGAW